MTGALHLATFNLLSGRSLADGRADPDRLAAAAAELDVDVLALQEVDRGQLRSGSVDQAALVAAASGAVDHRFVPLVAGTPGEPGWRPVPQEEGFGVAGPSTYGIALASRREVRSWHVLRLRPPRGRYPIPVPSRPPRVLWIPDEPRAAVAAVLADPVMTVACTHLSFVPGANALQLRRVRSWLAALPGPRVLLGDLNLPGRLPARITGWRSLADDLTFPAPAPRLQLDHVLAHELDDAVADSRAVALPVSDHRALRVSLRAAR